MPHCIILPNLPAFASSLALRVAVYCFAPVTYSLLAVSCFDFILLLFLWEISDEFRRSHTSSTSAILSSQQGWLTDDIWRCRAARLPRDRYNQFTNSGRGKAVDGQFNYAPRTPTDIVIYTRRSSAAFLFLPVSHPSSSHHRLTCLRVRQPNTLASSFDLGLDRPLLGKKRRFLDCRDSSVTNQQRIWGLFTSPNLTHPQLNGTALPWTVHMTRLSWLVVEMRTGLYRVRPVIMVNKISVM